MDLKSSKGRCVETLNITIDAETFEQIIHTANWPRDYDRAHWEKEHVAVLGSGASSIQVVPNMQPHVKSLDVFIRTGVWFVQIAEHFAQNHIYNYMNRLLPAFFSGSPAAMGLREHFKDRMRKHIGDERLLDGFMPNYGVGCEYGNPSLKGFTNSLIKVDE